MTKLVLVTLLSLVGCALAGYSPSYVNCDNYYDPIYGLSFGLYNRYDNHYGRYVPICVKTNYGTPYSIGSPLNNYNRYGYQSYNYNNYNRYNNYNKYSSPSYDYKPNYDEYEYDDYENYNDNYDNYDNYDMEYNQYKGRGNYGNKMSMKPYKPSYQPNNYKYKSVKYGRSIF